MNTSEVLDRAADEIERRGWVGTGFTSRDLNPWGGGSAGTGPLCIEGAVGAALDLDLSEEGARCLHLWPSAAYAALADYLNMSREADGRIGTTLVTVSPVGVVRVGRLAVGMWSDGTAVLGARIRAVL